MIKSRFMLLPLLGGLAVLAGCKAMGGGSCLKPPDAVEAGDLPPLRIPLGLDAPDTRAALAIPPLETPAAPAPAAGCLEDPPQIVTLTAPTQADRDKSKAASRGRGSAKDKAPKGEASEADDPGDSGSSRRKKRPPGRPGL